MSHDLKHGQCQRQKQHETLGHKKITNRWVEQLRHILKHREYQPETVDRIVRWRAKHG